jgi:hypothetical protein
VTEIDHEQRYVTMLYTHLDGLLAEATARATSCADTAPVWRAEAARLGAVADGLCFGRLDLADGRRVHIGRTSLFRDGDGNSDSEPLLLDWRAPAAQAFYTATAGAPQGVRRRRRITTRGRTVVALDDELFDESAGADDTLVGEAALLAAVTAARTGRMRDIVTTMRAEQDRIIRDDPHGVLVVQGGPGTGKTAVALHRVAYLMYTRPALRTRGVLVVGPSRLFLDYIGQVLPGLGERSVVTATIADLVPGVEVTRVESPGAALRKGRAEAARLLAAAVRAHVPDPDEPVEVDFEQQVLRLSPAACRAAIRTARATGLPHNQARLVFQREVVAALARDLAAGMEAVVLTDTGEAIDGGSADGRLGAAELRALAAAGVVVDPGDDAPRVLLDDEDKAALRAALLADAGVLAAADRMWPPLTPADVVPGAGGWSAEDVPLLDEAAALTGEGNGDGNGVTFGHVVVDEAQELSEMAWRMLVRRCPAGSMTIVGDLAQTGAPAGASSWDRVLRSHLGDRWRLAELTVNYRTPAEVMAATEDLLAAYHPGARPPRSVRSAGETPWRVRAPVTAVAGLVPAGIDGQVAVIAPDRHIGALATVLSVAPQADLTGRIVLLTPSEAKGLEFDVVLIADPAAIIAAHPLGHNDLYVAMTRATRTLGVVHPGPPPPELSALREIKPGPSHAQV